MNEHQTFCTIQRLSPNGTQPPECLLGALQGFADQRLLFTTSQPCSPTGTVSVEYEDVLFVGEVLACRADPNNTWTVLVQIRQRLNGLESLLRLRRQLLDAEPRPAFFPPSDGTPAFRQASLLPVPAEAFQEL